MGERPECKTEGRTYDFGSLQIGRTVGIHVRAIGVLYFSKTRKLIYFPQHRWRYSLDKEVDSTQKFAHLWQVLSREKPVGPIVSLTMRDNKVMVVRERPRDKTMASMPLDSFKGRQVEHRMKAKFGSKGSFNYTLTDLDTGERLMDVAYHGSVGRRTSSYPPHPTFLTRPR
jgi:hypothetical protein